MRSGDSSSSRSFNRETCDLSLVSDQIDSHDFSLVAFDNGRELALPADIGPYVLTQLIGAGGMGRVYKATHLRMERDVALKLLAPEWTQDKLAIERFFAEARAAAKLLHPNIVTAFDSGSASDLHYLVMEYVDGMTLTEKVRRQGPLDLQMAVDVIRQAAMGLHEAHEAGIVHRDVKPSNFILSAQGVVKLLDLGLATMRHQTLKADDRPHRLVGTIEYMSPEQIRSPAQADARSDVYSLGGTFYFLLTGETLFKGDRLTQARAHCNQAIPNVFDRRPDVDIRLDKIMRRMLAKSVCDRYSNMEDVLCDLDQWSSGVTVPGWSSSTSCPLPVSDETIDASTATTAQGRLSILGLDLGMFHIAAAISDAGQGHRLGSAGGGNHPLLASAVAVTDSRAVFGIDAIELRSKRPHRLAHCVPFYFGTSTLDRHLGDRQCPPEVAMGMILCNAASNAWQVAGRPAVVALTVPGCYDQLRRRSVLQAGKIAGFDSLRLVDRALAAAQSQLTSEFATTQRPAIEALQHWLVVSVTGLAMEVSVVRHDSGRLQTVSCVGDWRLGVLSWQQRVVDFVVADCLRRSGLDPRRELRDAVRLQLACEDAVRQLLTSTHTTIHYRVQGRDMSVGVSRQNFATWCNTALEQLDIMIETAIAKAELGDQPIDRCLTLGSLARLPEVVSRIGRHHALGSPPSNISRAATAAGASAIVLNELPSLSPSAAAAQSCTSCDLGLFGSMAAGNTRCINIVPAGSVLPFRVTRRIAQAASEQSNTITIVESKSSDRDNWRSLGSIALPQAIENNQVKVVFEVDENGLLRTLIGDPETGQFKLAQGLPRPMVDEAEIANWNQWILQYMGQPASRP